MSGRRKAQILEVRKTTTAKPLPAILNRKRKNDEDPMQPDLHGYFSAVNQKTEHNENLKGVSFANIQISRPSTSSRVPLATLSLSSENIVSADPSPNPDMGYALKLPGRHHSEPISSLVASPSTPTSSTSGASLSPNSQKENRRKQTLSWKKPRMRDSWSQFRSFISEPVHKAERGIAPLPELSWASKQEMWDLMVKKESGMYMRHTAEGMLSRHPALQPRMRAILLDWLIEVCEVYRLHRETFYLAVDFIDRFLGVAPAVPKNRLQLIGVTSLFIGAKIEEIYPPKLQEFAYVTDGACTEEEILQMELMILKGLNWGLSPMTPNAWMRMYMQILHGSKRPLDESFSLPAYSGLPFSQVMQLVDLCMLDVGSLEFSYSVLATSALYHTESEAVALSVSGYSWQDIAQCVRWMSAFAFALRERSPLQPKSFHGIQPDDAHHLQTHAVDLDLLGRAQDRLHALATGGLRDSPDPNSQSQLPSGLDNTPQEEEGDVMYQPKGSHTMAPIIQAPHPALLSPPLDSDIW
eukprot:GFUD01039568.1.p1 GENE.GFUD01039568.1~~GFUD01039568.1.p1  ORF type:complete len:524 (+),score=128.08 GFUD01039568.1:219-1790(+)